MSILRPLHIVQLGSDDSVFQKDAPSDSIRRQRWYGEILNKKRPGSHLTCLILTRQNVSAVHHENVSFVPVKSIRFLKNIWIWFALRKLHRQRTIDVISPQDVDSIGWVVPIFGKLYAVPSVAQIHHDLFSPHSMRDHMGSGIIGWILKKLTFFFLRKFFAVRVVGREVGEYILKSGLHSKVSVIPVAVTLLQEKCQLNTHDHQVPRVLFVGRLSSEKNLSLWLDVAQFINKRNPEIEFDIVGDGPEAEMLKSKVQSLGLGDCVHFHGAVPYERLAGFYLSASVFLLTSHYEGFGRVLVEACAYGLPPVAPRISGVKDVILDQETGFLCTPDDASRMAERVLQLIESPDLRRDMGKRGEEYVVSTFDPNKLADAWVSYLVQNAPESVTLPPLKPTFKRWWRYSTTTFSMLRGFEYEAINGLTLEGRTLDIGGGMKNDYYDKIIFIGQVDSINIDRSIKPSILADLNQSLPIRDIQYDNILSLNTFEHIYQDKFAIREAFRVLKTNGLFHIIIPFLYIVHGSPFDYHRHPAAWWLDYINSLGVPRENILIEPLMWDAVSSGFAISEFQFRFRWLWKRIVMLPPVVRSLWWQGQDRLPWLMGERQSAYALGYYIHGKK